MTTTAPDLGTLEILPDAVAAEALQRRHEDQRELKRRLGVSILQQRAEGRKFPADALADARTWAAFPVLNRPLGTGEPS